MIYFVQDSATHHIKIGFVETNSMESVEARVKTLHTGNPSLLRILATRIGEKRIETNFHRLFAAHRVQGEWFKPAPEIIATIIEIKVDQELAAQREELTNPNRHRDMARGLISRLEEYGWRLEPDFSARGYRMIKINRFPVEPNYGMSQQLLQSRQEIVLLLGREKNSAKPMGA